VTQPRPDLSCSAEPPLVASAERALPDLSTTPSTPAIDCAALAHRFGSRWALRGVSLRLAEGEVVAVFGPNGSGKSTLLRILATALRPTRGGGTVCGHDILRESAAIRSVVALSGQGAGIYDDLTVSENVVFAMRMSGLAVDPAQLRSVIDEVGLGAERDERARHLSAGMRRRIVLAQIRLRPLRLLLLDEPYTSFDDEGVAYVNGVIRSLREQGGSAVIVTHDADRVREVADRTLRLESGLIDGAEPPGTGAIPSRPPHLRLTTHA